MALMKISKVPVTEVRGVASFYAMTSVRVDGGSKRLFSVPG